MSTTPETLADRIVADPAGAGLFLDFDGTLAPIVTDPASSRMPEHLAPVLVRLAGSLALLAIVSGRPAAFLADRVTAPGARLLGVYGLQEWVDGHARPRPEAAAWQAVLVDARDRLRAGVGARAGINVEDKGLGVAVHWRNAADGDAAEAAVAQAVREIAAETGLAVEPGKFVLELRPPVEWDKGAGVRHLAQDEQLRTVVYVGDDRGDLPALAAARALGGVACAVAHGAETPPDVLAAADVMFTGTEAVASWLVALDERLADSR